VREGVGEGERKRHPGFGVGRGIVPELPGRSSQRTCPRGKPPPPCPIPAGTSFRLKNVCAVRRLFSSRHAAVRRGMARVAGGGNRGHFPPWKSFERTQERIRRKHILHSRCSWAGMERGGGRNPPATTLCHHQAVRPGARRGAPSEAEIPPGRPDFL